MDERRARTLNFWLSVVLLVACVVLGIRVAVQGRWIIVLICALLAVSQLFTLWRLTRRGPGR